MWHFPIPFHALLFYVVFFDREYVVDLVGQPGNVHGPDSSINGGLLSSMPSPFQVSHLKEFQQPYVDASSSYQILNSQHTRASPRNPLYSGTIHLHILKGFYLFKKVVFYFLIFFLKN